MDAFVLSLFTIPGSGDDVHCRISKKNRNEILTILRRDLSRHRHWRWRFIDSGPQPITAALASTGRKGIRVGSTSGKSAQRDVRDFRAVSSFASAMKKIMRQQYPSPGRRIPHPGVKFETDPCSRRTGRSRLPAAARQLLGVISGIVSQGTTIPADSVRNHSDSEQAAP